MIRLEPFTTQDIPVMLHWNFSEEELLQFAGTAFTHPLTAGQIVAFMTTTDSIFYKAIEGDIMIGIGEVVLMEHNVAKLARIAIGDRNSRGKGLGTRMMNAFIEHTLEVLKREQIILNVFEWNEGAIKCYEKIGFVFTDEPKRSFEFPNGQKWFSKQMKLIRK